MTADAGRSVVKPNLDILNKNLSSLKSHMIILKVTTMQNIVLYRQYILGNSQYVKKRTWSGKSSFSLVLIAVYIPVFDTRILYILKKTRMLSRRKHGLLNIPILNILRLYVFW